jgi:uncharacterized protein with HEPN domain
MTGGRSRNETNRALGIEHLQIALAYAGRGRKVFFNERDPDTRRLVEAELRKAYESINRLGDSFWNAYPRLDRARVGAIREELTHEYPEVTAIEVWKIVSEDARPLLHQLSKAKVPKGEEI